MTSDPPPTGAARSAVYTNLPHPADAGETMSDAMLSRVIDALTVALVYRDQDGRRVIANSAAYSLLGLDEAATSPNEILAALTRIAGASLERPGPDEFDVERDGRLYHIGSRTIHGAIGNGLLWRLEDVTEERQRRAQLAEAKRRALIAEVAGGVGHQFNNLLARLICQAESIQDATTSDELHAMAEQIITTAEAGAETLRRLMTYAGGAVVDCRDVELTPLVEAWKSGLESPLIIDAGGMGGAVVADHDLLRASFDELHANAVQASATALHLRCAGAGADRVVLEIIDDGVGMTPEDCARAADPFFTRKRVGDGAGLGLSMVQGAMRQCGGSLEIVSHPGKGTTVRLMLARGGEHA